MPTGFIRIWNNQISNCCEDFRSRASSVSFIKNIFPFDWYTELTTCGEVDWVGDNLTVWTTLQVVVWCGEPMIPQSCPAPNNTSATCIYLLTACGDIEQTEQSYACFIGGRTWCFTFFYNLITNDSWINKHHSLRPDLFVRPMSIFMCRAPRCKLFDPPPLWGAARASVYAASPHWPFHIQPDSKPLFTRRCVTR